MHLHCKYSSEANKRAPKQHLSSRLCFGSMKKYYSFLLISLLFNCRVGSTVPEDKIVFMETKTTVTGQIGENLVLKCKVTSSPPATIHWLFKGQRIVQDSTLTVLDDDAIYEEKKLSLAVTESKLFIDCADETDAGSYTCVAQSPVKRKRLDFDVTLNGEVADNYCTRLNKGKRISEMRHQIPARVTMWSPNKMEEEHTDAHLFCRVSGFPKPTVTWYNRINKKITENMSKYKLLRNGDLIIRNANFLDDMGSYKCIAKNSFSEDSQSTFLYPVSFSL
ncbi:DgyrCDS13700 [Dimorphilus gyrociliatus]|uniref:DgyrCDS13700 n=1 Tax=Dimorphilus gyrociliatus TaxID=2664684 RepID=A0A7I8WBG4_9ANNE|nr:DgyrCDS13700 [Dimorphilus gyrociliatus]